MICRFAGLVACIAASLVAFSSGRAVAANLLEMNFWLSGPRYDGALPACEAGLDQIRSDFGVKERRFWQSDLQILEFDRVQETAFRPWAPDTIPRRFCKAVAHTSDGKWRAVYYSIGEDTGFVGASWGVDWCVVGVDRNWSHNPGCKTARP